MSIWQDIQRHVGVSPDGIPGPTTAAAIAKALGVAQEPAQRQISAAGLSLIKQSEGLVLKAYEDAADVLTIGYGHTGPDVKPGSVITEAQADALLAKDVERFEAAVRRLCPVTTQGQFDALVSFSFNLGEEALAESTLRKLHNEAAWEAAAGQFARWNKARVGGVLKELAGLTKRRAAEAKMYRGQA